ncbi:MAG TPA: LysR substrate-binding domain-containing protein, partial [Bacillota bacterium]|nr:LysR substrate-binding domain-containing protein [Bacillota bacterium]
KQLTISGIGITLLPKVAVEDELSEGQLQTLQWSGPEINMMTQVVIHKNKWLSAPLKVFLDLTREMEPFIFNHSG